MKLALDVSYESNDAAACAAALVFGDWGDAVGLAEAISVCGPVLPYIPGEFYRRELPCILPLARNLLTRIPGIRSILVDGYVDLGARGPGLGRHLFDALDGRIEVIGIAKSHFVDGRAVPVYRQGSRRPLWVSSTGDLEVSATNVRSMFGAGRIPALLRQVDELARRRLHIRL